MAPTLMMSHFWGLKMEGTSRRCACCIELGRTLGLLSQYCNTKGMGCGETEMQIHFEGEQVEAVNHLKMRSGCASMASGQLFKMGKSKGSLKAKLYMYNAFVESTLCYSSVTWVTNNTEEKRLNALDNPCRHRILGIKWYHRVRSTLQTPAPLFLKTRRLRFS